MKRIFSLLLALLLIFPLAGCGGTAEVVEGVAQEAHDLIVAERDELAQRILALEEGAREQELALEALAQELLDSQTRAEGLERQLEQVQAELEEAKQQLEQPPREPETGPAAPPPAPAPAPEPANTGGLVWIPKTGTKYHSTSTCSNMKNPSQVSLEQAIALGYGRCSKCW